MDRTKADFRALRDLVGMSQPLMASELGVAVLTVKRWERPDQQWEPPADAWDLLDEARARQREVVSYALAKVGGIVSEAGNPPRSVTLRYYRSPEDYEATHPGEGRYWQMSDANSRLAADALERAGYTVHFAYGDEGNAAIAPLP